MECHRCRHHGDVVAGRYAKTAFRLTPCGKCELREVSLRTMEVDPERPVYVPGVVLPGTTPGQADCGFHVDVPFPEEAEVAVAKLPVNVMEEFVGRLLTLPQDVRDVVCWRFAGLTYPEIAQKQRITSAGAEARHRRAIRLFPELRQLFILKTRRHGRRRRRAAVRRLSGAAEGEIGGCARSFQ